MENAVLPFTLASVPFLALAWREAARGRHGPALALLMIGGTLLRLGPCFDPFLHPWDERYHALVAKNLMAHPLRPTLYEHPALPYDATSWVGGHVWLHKPPLTLWCMAVSMKLFGVNGFAVRFPSLVATVLGIAICHALVSALLGRRSGFVAAFLFAIQGAVIEFASGRVATDHVDTLFAVLVGFSIGLALPARTGRTRWWLVGSGAVLGLAVLTKWMPALMALPVQFLLLLDGPRRNWRAAFLGTAMIMVVAFIVAAPWMVYARMTYPEIAEAVDQGRLARFAHVVDGQGDGPLYYLDRLRIRYGDLVYLPCAWFLWTTFRKRIDIDRWALAAWFVLPYLFFSCCATKMQGYVLPCTIPILAMTAAYWTWLERRWHERMRWRWAHLAVLIALLALPARYTLERLKPLADQRPMAVLEQRIRGLSSPVPADRTIVVGPYPIETMFYTPFTAYEKLTPDEAERLIADGYRILPFHPER